MHRGRCVSAARSRTAIGAAGAPRGAPVDRLPTRIWLQGARNRLDACSREDYARSRSHVVGSIWEVSVDMLAAGPRRTGNRRPHGDRTHRPGALVRGTWTRLLVLAIAMARVGSIEATDFRRSAGRLWACGGREGTQRCDGPVDRRSCAPRRGRMGVPIVVGQADDRVLGPFALPIGSHPHRKEPA